MSTRRKVSLGLLVISGCLFGIASYLDSDIPGLLVAAGVVLFIASAAFFMEIMEF